jgi:LacI family transcriptional regulator, repressor for deo operon, udp, cdd, tsx, nupC, and nupG
VRSGAQNWVIATRRHAATRRTTIADVAREAGVNKGTVSRALRGIPGVGPSTRQRIIQTADRLDFSASRLASALASGRSRTIGIVLPTLRSWYFSEFASGASEILTPAGYRVELINLDVNSDDLDVDSATFRHLFGELGAGRGRDALLLAGTIPADLFSAEDESPRVAALATGSPLTSVPGIFIDHRAGGRLAAEHLLGLGHRRIGIIDGRMPDRPGAWMWEHRTQGLRSAVRAAGLEIDPADVVAPGDCHPADGERAMAELLDRPGEKPTAIFCHTDELAFGAIATLRHHGLQCPTDISVAGFDDHPMSRYWGLTTVSQHAHEQGVRAAYALVDVLDDNEEPAHRPVDDLTVELVIRETTGPPRVS